MTLLTPLIEAVIDDVQLLALFCNSALPPSVLADLTRRHGQRLELLGNGTNVGLGAAYNAILEWAMARGMERALLLDQDSSATRNLAEGLVRRMQVLIDARRRPAVIGPLLVSGEGANYKAPRGLKGEGPKLGASVPVGFVISSGSLIDTQAFREAGPFRSDFFIDAIDIEWCFRARSKGFSCWLATDLPMGHRLGSGILRIPLLGVRLIRQPPQRVYTFIRNQLAMLRLAHTPLSWKWRAAVLLLVHSIGQLTLKEDRPAMLRAITRGWRDGLSNRLGPPDEQPTDSRQQDK